jgi:hypothetical protein
MYTIFLPDGTVLPTGFETVIVLGRCIAWLTTFWAAARFALLEPLAAALLALLELLDEPHPAATAAITKMLAATPAPRRIRLRAGVNRNMTVVSSWWGLVGC